MTNNISNLLKYEKTKESTELKKIMTKISKIDTSYSSMQPGSGTMNILNKPIVISKTRVN
jgi:hypothetical protein